MTNVYFVRHAQPNYLNRNDRERELTEKGLQDRRLVTEFLMDKDISALFSSPYRRAWDTLSDFARERKLAITAIEDFRERRIDTGWIEDFDSFCRQQWADFTYKLSDGESLQQVQERNIAALEQVLESCRDQNIAIGSHGTALSTVLHYYDESFGYEAFQKIRHLMPWVVRLRFDGSRYLGMESWDLLAAQER